MSPFTVVLPEAIWDEILVALERGVESAGVLVARVVAGPDEALTLCGRDLAWAPEHAYRRREVDELVLDSAGWVPGVGRAAADDAAAVFLHTHPGGRPAHSSRDHRVDAVLGLVCRRRTRQRFYAHLVVGGTREAPLVSAVALDEAGGSRTLRCVRVVGARLRLLLPVSDDMPEEPSVFDRHVRAFGAPGQRMLRALRVGVVGAGGTGSAVIDQLARLGVGRITSIDPKRLTEGNVTRVHGAGVADVGRPKVEVMADHVARIGLGTELIAYMGSITEERAARLLRHCDVAFGCTDDNAGRLVLSRLGYWYLLPVIDLGVRIETTDGTVDGVYGRVTMAGPSAACLVCRGRVDQDLAHAEALAPDERERLQAEGYVVGLPEPDPSVVSFTTHVATIAVEELVQRLLGYGPGDTPSEQIHLIDRRSVRTNTRSPREGCYCCDPAVLGASDVTPLLDRTWI